MGRVRLSGGRASEGARRGGGRRRRGGAQATAARAGAVEQRGEGSRGHTVQRASRRGARALPAGPRVRRAPGALRGPRHLPREHPAPRHTRPSSRAIIIIIVIVIPPRGGVVGKEHGLALALALGLPFDGLRSASTWLHERWVGIYCADNSCYTREGGRGDPVRYERGAAAEAEKKKKKRRRRQGRGVGGQAECPRSEQGLHYRGGGGERAVRKFVQSQNVRACGRAVQDTWAHMGAVAAAYRGPCRTAGDRGRPWPRAWGRRR